jgi:sulfonate transport system permease protein
MTMATSFADRLPASPLRIGPRRRPAPPAATAPAAHPTPAPGQARARHSLGLGTPFRYGWLLGPGLVIAYWAAGSASGFIDPRVLPAPWVAVETGVDLWRQGRLQPDILISVARLAEGIGLGVALGLLLALISGLSLLGGYIFDGIIQIKRALPVVALIPFFILWFGIGEVMKVTVIALVAFLPVYVQVHDALRNIDLRYVELAETLRLNQWRFLRHVVLPAALPGILLGLRYGAAGALLGLVVVEEVNSTNGIGHMVDLARTYAQTDVMVVGLVLYTVLGVGSDLLVRLLRNRLLGWRRTLGQ